MISTLATHSMYLSPIIMLVMPIVFTLPLIARNLSKLYSNYLPVEPHILYCKIVKNHSDFPKDTIYNLILLLYKFSLKFLPLHNDAKTNTNK